MTFQFFLTNCLDIIGPGRKTCIELWCANLVFAFWSLSSTFSHCMQYNLSSQSICHLYRAQHLQMMASLFLFDLESDMLRFLDVHAGNSSGGCP